MKLTAVSSKSQIGNVTQNLSTTKTWIEKLSQQGADFILFPELNLSGYTKNRAILNEVVKQKEAVFQELVIVSHQSKAAFAVGFPEKEEGKYYISHFLFHQGKHIGTHRKTHLGPTEKETFTEGNEIEVFEVGELKIGIQLCFETHFPEISYAQAQQGANVVAMAFASPREDAETKLERFKRFLPARAYDNACFVVACNLQQEEEETLADKRGFNRRFSQMKLEEPEIIENHRKDLRKSSRNFPGLSLITNPKGIILQQAISDKNEISAYLRGNQRKSARNKNDYVIAEIDLKQVGQIKQSRMGYFNKSKRVNLFQKYYGGQEL